MSDPLVSSSATTPAEPAVQTSQPAGDVKTSVLAWLGADSDNKEAEFIMSQLKGDNILDAISELKDLERRLGAAKFGEQRSQRLYNYLKVLSQFKESKKLVEDLER